MGYGAELLPKIGLTEADVERFRGAYIDPQGVLCVLTRTGGGNRAEHRNLKLRSAPGWLGTYDDEADYTYAWDEFRLDAPEGTGQ